MSSADLILVSVDDHVVEPPDMFVSHVPKKFAGSAPRMVHKADEDIDVWVYDGQEIANIGLNAVMGRPLEEYGMEPTSFEEMRPGAYDVDARVKDMDANGVLGSMCFPSMPQFCGQRFMRTADKDVGLAMVRAYNDWHIADWCGRHPGRFIPLAIPPLWSPELMAEEVLRAAALGCHAVSFTENPTKLGLPSLYTDHWEPFWRACVDVGTVVCIHFGSSSSIATTSDDAPADVRFTLSPMNLYAASADLVWSGVLRRHPALRVALSEGGIGWVPYFVERIDNIYKRHRAWTGQDFGDRLPSEVFLDQVVLCFIEDSAGLSALDRLNIENVTWESDYPHSDAAWPDAPEVAHEQLNGLPQAAVDAITHENAMRVFQYDPFSVLPRESATVGALRARDPEWDVSIVSSGKVREPGKTGTGAMALARYL